MISTTPLANSVRRGANPALSSTIDCSRTAQLRMYSLGGLAAESPRGHPASRACGPRSLPAEAKIVVGQCLIIRHSTSRVSYALAVPGAVILAPKRRSDGRSGPQTVPERRER